MTNASSVPAFAGELVASNEHTLARRPPPPAWSTRRASALDDFCQNARGPGMPQEEAPLRDERLSYLFHPTEDSLNGALAIGLAFRL
jgi:hypothetical protein